MAIFILNILIGVCLGKDMMLNFHENGGGYQETVKIDKTSVEFDVPYHNGIEKTKYLNDYEAGLIVIKMDRLQKCYAKKLPIGESTPDAIEAGIKEFNNRFPQDKFIVSNEDDLPLYRISDFELTSKIKAFCRTYPVIKIAQFKSLAEVEAAVLQKVNDSRRRIPKQVPADDFYLCNASDSGKFIGCGKNVKLRCKVSTTTCIYVVSCPRRNDQFICDIPKHSYSHFVCCTPYC